MCTRSAHGKGKANVLSLNSSAAPTVTAAATAAAATTALELFLSSSASSTNRTGLVFRHKKKNHKNTGYVSILLEYTDTSQALQ